jgi:hypothetical protein
MIREHEKRLERLLRRLLAVKDRRIEQRIGSGGQLTC